MNRELVVLGCSSQAPTRHRNHNGYFLRFDREGILFDPGEGTQRQMILAGVSAHSITAICITHFHGDHCLGLPGVLARIAVEGGAHPVDVYYPAAGQQYFDRLVNATVSDHRALVRAHPVPGSGSALPSIGELQVKAEPLDHRTDTLGWRIEEPDGVRMLEPQLAARGVHGPAVGELRRSGSLEVGGAVVRLEDVSEPRPGQKVAFVMDTRVCANANRLAIGVDMLICESTFLESEAHLAAEYAHMTAAQAATLATDAGARKLVLTHYSARYRDEGVFVEEAAPIFGACRAVQDLDVVPVPPR